MRCCVCSDFQCLCPWKHSAPLKSCPDSALGCCPSPARRVARFVMRARMARGAVCPSRKRVAPALLRVGAALLPPRATHSWGAAFAALRGEDSLLARTLTGGDGAGADRIQHQHHHHQCP